MELVELTNSFRWQDPNQNTEARCLVYLCGPVSSYWPPTNSNPQNLNQHCPLQISSQALFLEGSQLHLAAAVQCSQIVRTKDEKARNLDSTSLKGQVLTTRFITKIISTLFPSNLNDIPHLFATIITALLQKKVSELNSCATVTTDGGSPLLIVDWEQPLFYEGSDKTYESQYNQLQR